MANIAIKYRIYPTEEQAGLFAKTFGCCRKVYNLMLADKIESYKTTGKFVSVTPAKYKADHPYLKEVDSLALANVQLNLQRAFQNRFDTSRKKRNSFPRFKSKKLSRRSYTTNNQNGTVAIIGNTIKLPKTGRVKAKIHRLPREDWRLKSATISMESDGKYYASVLFEYERDADASKTIETILGLDYRSDGLYMDSNGNIGSNHKYYRESHKRLAKEQRKLSRKTGSKAGETKSNNYLKQLKRVNKIHRHIANQRKDNLHKISTEIANRYDAVCVEDLNMRAMSNKGFGNGKATMDNGYGMFVNMLEYKMAARGKHFIKVDKWYPSSQICSCCGKQKGLALSDRIYKCECGLTIDRDLNAAINIREEGLRMLNTAA